MDTFRNRTEAGIKLAEELQHLRQMEPVVLAMPRGGVVVGYEAASSLDAPLDVLVCRKLGAPGHEEFGFGAVGPGGLRFLDDRTVAQLQLSPRQIDLIAEAALAEVRRCEELYRDGRPPLDVHDRTIILVDDGLATGVTARAAVRWAARQNPRHLALAVPVGPSDTLHIVAAEVDELVCLKIPRDFQAVGQWYEDFAQVSDEEVIRLLRLARGHPAPAAGGQIADEAGPRSCDPKEVAHHDPHHR